MTTTANPAHTVDSLLRVVEAYEAEVARLKLMVDKLKLQVLRGNRARFGSTSEQLNSPQMALLEGKRSIDYVRSDQETTDAVVEARSDACRRARESWSSHTSGSIDGHPVYPVERRRI